MNEYDLRLLRNGAYEGDEIRVLEKHLQPKGVVLELGGNLGIVARHGFGIMAKGGKWVTVEANPYVIPYLKANMKRAQAQHPDCHHEIVHAAIAYKKDADGCVDFVVENTMMSHVNHGAGGHERTVRVPAVTLGELIEKYSPAAPVALVCDIEGSEIDMISHDQKALERVSQICIELHDDKNRPEHPIPVVLREFQDLGFSIGTQSGNTYYMSRDNQSPAPGIG
jgi:FkbM family methyltransferase